MEEDRKPEEARKAQYVPPNKPYPSGELYAALAQAQAKFPEITRSKTVKVKSKRTGAEYSFSYAPYEEIVRSVKEGLAENGLCFFHRIEGSLLFTVLGYKDGTSIESQCIIPHFNDNQELGSHITYLKRYQLSGILGLATEEDDDSNRAIGNEYQEKPKRKSASKKDEGRLTREDEDPKGQSYVSPGQVRLLRAQMGDYQEDLEKSVCEKFKVDTVESLPASQINAAIELVKGLKSKHEKAEW